MVTGTASFTGNVAVVSNPFNVANRGESEIEIFALPGANVTGHMSSKVGGGDNNTGKPRDDRMAGFPLMIAGVPQDFYLQWDRIKDGGKKLTTRIIVPAGWSDVHVPPQDGIAGQDKFTAIVRQPTPTSEGEVLVYDADLHSLLQLYFQARPTPGTTVLGMDIKSENGAFATLLWFGVRST